MKKLRASLLLLILAAPPIALADVQIQCAPAPPPPPPTRFDWMFPKGVKLTGREANWTRGYVGRLWLQGLRSYSTTGHLPDSNVWKYLQRQHDLHPAAFNTTHPYFQGLFNAPGTVGQLPGGKFWDGLADHYENRPILFDRRYPYLTEVMDRDQLASTLTPTPTPVPTPIAPPPPPPSPGEPTNPETPGGGPILHGVPEPASIVMTASGLGALALIVARARRRWSPA